MFKKVYLFLLTIFLFFQSISYASIHNWQWVESNENYGYFVDINSINKTSIFEAEAWVKIKYSLAGARKELKYLNHINENLLANDGSNIIKLKINFLRGEVTVINRTFLDKDGNILYKSSEEYTHYVDVNTFFSPIFTYISNYLFKTNDYNIYKEYFYPSQYDISYVSDNSTTFYMVLWRAYYSNDDIIVVPIQTWNNEPIKYINCVYRSFDLKNNTVRLIKIIKDGEIYQYDSSEYDYIIPNSVAEGQLNRLKKFAETHENFLHRFD